MYYWLERETQLLKELGDYKIENQLDLNNVPFSFDESNQECIAISNYTDEDCIELSITKEAREQLLSEEPSLLHEQVLNDQKTFQEKIFRLNKRKEWLRSNELLLRTFLSYCSLHKAGGGNNKKFFLQEIIFFSIIHFIKIKLDYTRSKWSSFY